MPLSPEERRQVNAWCMYDWSTQGYMLTTASVLLPTFFVTEIAPEGAVVLGREIPALALWSFAFGLAAFISVCMAPVIGAIADYTRLRKEFLTVSACGGSLFASLLFFARSGTVWLALAFFVAAHVCFTAGNVFYDSFLPQLVPDKYIDKISGRGFAFGYIGGAVQFALALCLITFHDQVGLSQVMAIRVSLLSAGLWWIGFAAFALSRMKNDQPHKGNRPGFREIPSVVGVGVSRTCQVLKRLPKFPSMLLFLFAFLIYNDGIQTVIGVAGSYAGAELKLGVQAIMAAFLVVQLVAFFGAIFFGHLAGWIGAKRSILVALAAWIGVVGLAYFLRPGDLAGFITLCVIAGLVLGGSQALSRSLFASMIPREASANFFGFYSVFNKLSAISGPLLFGGLVVLFDSGRPAILAIAAYFVIGGTMLAFVNVKKARASRNLWHFENGKVDHRAVTETKEAIDPAAP